MRVPQHWEAVLLSRQYGSVFVSPDPAEYFEQSSAACVAMCVCVNVLRFLFEYSTQVCTCTETEIKTEVGTEKNIYI